MSAPLVRVRDPAAQLVPRLRLEFLDRGEAITTGHLVRRLTPRAARSRPVPSGDRRAGPDWGSSAPSARHCCADPDVRVVPGALIPFAELAGFGRRPRTGSEAVDLVGLDDGRVSGLDTDPASRPLEGPVLAPVSMQLRGRHVIERTPAMIELMVLDSRSSQRLPLTQFSGRSFPGPSLRAARLTGHRNLDGKRGTRHTCRYEQPD